MQTISATDLARNTRKILDDVVSRGETVEIERNNVTVARLIPPETIMTAAQALAGFRPILTPGQAAAWLKNSREGFDQSVNDPFWRQP